MQCVHPGWDLLIGWEEVRERWARIFANAKRVRIALSSVWVRVEGDVGMGGVHRARDHRVCGRLR